MKSLFTRLLILFVPAIYLNTVYGCFETKVWEYVPTQLWTAGEEAPSSDQLDFLTTRQNPLEIRPLYSLKKGVGAKITAADPLVYTYQVNSGNRTSCFTKRPHQIALKTSLKTSSTLAYNSIQNPLFSSPKERESNEILKHKRATTQVKFQLLNQTIDEKTVSFR